MNSVQVTCCAGITLLITEEATGWEEWKNRAARIKGYKIDLKSDT